MLIITRYSHRACSLYGYDQEHPLLGSSYQRVTLILHSPVWRPDAAWLLIGNKIEIETVKKARGSSLSRFSDLLEQLFTEFEEVPIIREHSQQQVLLQVPNGDILSGTETTLHKPIHMGHISLDAYSAKNLSLFC